MQRRSRKEIFGAVTLAAAASCVGFAPGSAIARSSPLTEYGATRAAWARAHTADSNPKLVGGCCFLPRQSTGMDRYFAVQYGTGLFAPTGLVFQFEMSFAPSISASQARAVVKQEAPPDSVLVADVKKPTCEVIEYRSAELYAAVGYRTMDAELSKTALGGTYTGVVGDILIGPTISPTSGC